MSRPPDVNASRKQQPSSASFSCPTIIVTLATFASLAIAMLAFQMIYIGVPSPLSVFQHHDYGGNYKGAVASESDICTKIGIRFLEKGGNAADALIATAFCLGVVAMYHVGIGGGGYGLVRGSDGSFETIDFKETAPAAAFEDMFANNVDGSLYGGLASAVPGELRGLERLHQRYASISWADLIQPAVKLARDGFPINEDLVGFMKGEDYLSTDPSFAIDFAPNGTLRALGEILTRERYAATLEKISNEGANTFYGGEIASATINAIQKANGTMTLQDLLNYRSKSRKPVQVSYRDFMITSDAVPAGGTQGLSIMKTIEGYDTMGQPEAVNLATHQLDEAIRFSWAEVNVLLPVLGTEMLTVLGKLVRLGDPLFNDTVEPFATKMVSEAAAKERRGKISDDRTLDPHEYGPQRPSHVQSSGTSAIVVADAAGLTIAWTSTINTFFGSHICVPETGFILNNHMNDFANPRANDFWGVPPSPVNFPRPGKRPMGSMFNIIVEHARNATPVLATGTAGGSHIITTGIEILWHVLDMGKSVLKAIKEPRFHDQLIPNLIKFDWTYDNATTASMKSRGHNITFIKPGYSINQALFRRWDGAFEAATEPTLVNAGASVT